MSFQASSHFTPRYWRALHSVKSIKLFWSWCDCVVGINMAFKEGESWRAVNWNRWREMEYSLWWQDKTAKRRGEIKGWWKNERRWLGTEARVWGGVKVSLSVVFKNSGVESPSICYCGTVLTQWFLWLALIPAEWRRQNEELKAYCWLRCCCCCCCWISPGCSVCCPLME